MNTNWGVPMRTLNAVVEREKLEFFQILREAYSDLDIEDIAIAASRIENLIQGRLVHSVLSNVETIFCRADISVVGSAFRFERQIYEISAAPDVRKPSDLCVSCIPRGIEVDLQGFFEINVHLHPPGKFKCIKFYLPKELHNIDEAFLNELSNGLFAVGYRWLIDAIARAISKAAANTKESLYQFVRVMISDDQYLDGVWFSALVSEGKDAKKDIVVLDDIAARLSMRAAEEAAHRLGQNAASIVTQMMTEVVDFEDSVISDIEDRTAPFEIDLSEDQYYQKDATFNLALRGVWGKSVICYPIISSGNFRLVAFYKPENAPVLQPFFDMHRAHLEAIGNAQAQSIRAGLDIMKAVRKASGNTGRVGDFLGGFTGGLIKSFSNT